MANGNARLDIWSGMDHKAEIDSAPAWVPEADQRRLNFYYRVSAYLETVARELLPDDGDDPTRVDEWREFGDPAVIVARIGSAVVGDDASISVDGADAPLSERPTLDPIPERLPEPDDADPAIATVLDDEFEAVLAVWVETAGAQIETWRTQLSELPALQARQDWLRRWEDDEQFFAKMFELETENVVPFGDGAYVLGWDESSRRPNVSIYEPDAYFPDLRTMEPGKYPRRVRIAWAFTDIEDSGDEVEKVRVLTYELVPVDEADPGTVVSFPYRDADDGDPTDVCLLTDATYLADDVGTIDDPQGTPEFAVAVDPDGGEVVYDRAPIGLDFIPVVHIPNTLASVGHYGRSSISRLGQLFDEIAANDTEESRAGRWAGRPPIGISGFAGAGEALDLSPGRAVKMPQGGHLTQIDMANNLEKLQARGENLRQVLSVNGQVPAGLLGRVDASEVPSGLALTLSFTPFEQLISALRMARQRKYRLLLTMVQRIAIANGDESLGGDDVVYPADLVFGSFMPQDLPGTAEIIGRLRTARAISIATAVRLASEAGVAVEDIEAEVAAIHATDGETADLITSATENPRYGAAFLGIDSWAPLGDPAVDGGPVPIPDRAQIGQ